jgi:hypothetical protein
MFIKLDIVLPLGLKMKFIGVLKSSQLHVHSRPAAACTHSRNDAKDFYHHVIIYRFNKKIITSKLIGKATNTEKNPRETRRDKDSSVVREKFVFAVMSIA